MKVSPFMGFLVFLLVLATLVLPVALWSGAPLSDPVVQPLTPVKDAPLPTSIAATND